MLILIRIFSRICNRQKPPKAILFEELNIRNTSFNTHRWKSILKYRYLKNVQNEKKKEIKRVKKRKKSFPLVSISIFSLVDPEGCTVNYSADNCVKKFAL